MAEKYTLAAGGSGLDRLLGVDEAIIQLSDGTVVCVYSDQPNQRYVLAHSADRSTWTTIGTQPYGGRFRIPGVTAQQVTVVRDAADNLYLIGADNLTSPGVVVVGYTKGAGYTWTAAAATGSGGLSTGDVGSVAAVWCNTGGGTNGKGHLAVLYGAAPDYTSGTATLDAGVALAGAGTLLIDHTGQWSDLTNGTGTSLQLVTDGLGATSGMLATILRDNSTVRLLPWTIDTTGTFTIRLGAAVTDSLYYTKIQLVRYAADRYALISASATVGLHRVGRYASTGRLAAPVDVNSGGQANHLWWACCRDPFAANVVWVIASNGVNSGLTGVAGYPLDLATGVSLGGAVGLGSYASYALQRLRATKDPTGGYVDWQLFSETAQTPIATYALLGDSKLFASAPTAPTITAPTNGGYVDTSAGLTVSHQVHSTDGADINAYALRLKAVGATQYSYWNASTSSWQTTIAWNPCSVVDGGTLTVAVPASATTPVGSAYNVSCADQESLAQLQGPFAPDIQFTARPGPTLVVTGPADPVTTTTRPTVTWTTTPAAGAQQTDYQVVVETGAYGAAPGSGTPVADSGVTSGAAQQWTLNADLVTGTRYRAFIRATQTGGQQTLWALHDWTEQLTPPAAPTAVASPTTDLITGAPQVTLSIASTDTGDWTPANTAFVVEFSDDQQAWSLLRNGTTTPDTNDTATVVDHWIVPGRLRWYRARTVGTTGGQTISSAASTPSPALVTTDSWWLLDATDPTSAVPVEASEQTAFTEVRDKAILLPLDDPAEDVTLPVVVRGAQRGMQATYTLRTRTRADRDRLLALIGRDTVWYLIATPDADGEAGDGWYVDIDATAINRVVQGKFGHRVIPVDVVQVAPP